MAAALRTCGLTEVGWVALLPSSHLPSSDSSLIHGSINRVCVSPLVNTVLPPMDMIWIPRQRCGIYGRSTRVHSVIHVSERIMSAQEKFDFSLTHIETYFRSKHQKFHPSGPCLCRRGRVNKRGRGGRRVNVDMAGRPGGWCGSGLPPAHPLCPAERHVTWNPLGMACRSPISCFKILTPWDPKQLGPSQKEIDIERNFDFGVII